MKDGGWKDSDKDKWKLTEAKDFVNPVIEGLWKPTGMQSATQADKTVTTKDTAADQGAHRPGAGARRGRGPRTTPYFRKRPESARPSPGFGGSMVCSGTVIKDANNPGKSNLVWAAGHCTCTPAAVAAAGTCFRLPCPSDTDLGKSEAKSGDATTTEMAPYGTWWADWASTSNQWIHGSAETAATWRRG